MQHVQYITIQIDHNVFILYIALVDNGTRNYELGNIRVSDITAILNGDPQSH